MKFLVMAAFATFLLATQTSNASAFSTYKPTIGLIPLAKTAVVAIVSDGCAMPAAIDGVPYFQMPTIPREQGVGGTSQVRIDLGANGGLIHEELMSSSGNSLLDAAALKSARMTRFTSEVANCQHVGGSYIYQVEF